MEEVVNRYELVKGAGIQASADFHVVSSQQSHRCSVLLLKDLPLEGRAEQQQVVVCRGIGKEVATIKIGNAGGKEEIGGGGANSQKMKDGLGLMAKSGRKNHFITLEVKG